MLALAACSTLPEVPFKKYPFPEDAHIGDVKDRPYSVLGIVKTRVDFQTLDMKHDENDLCRNYFNQGVADLLKMARKKGADAIVDVRSVAFYEDGKSETFQAPECSDDGQDGQVLLQAIAVKWKPDDDAEPVKQLVKSAIPAGAKEWPLLAPSTQKFRSLILRKNQDGVEGGIRIFAKPTRVVLFTDERKILDQRTIDAPRAWFTTEFLRSAKERTILLGAQGQENGEIKTTPYYLRSGRIEVESYTDQVSGDTDHMAFLSGPNSSWRLTDSDPHDILQVISDSKQILLVRYHFLGSDKGWARSIRAQAGTWSSAQTFPPEKNFPTGSE